MSKTNRIVAEGWDEHVQCEIDHPCCTVEESFLRAKQQKIQTTRSDIMTKQDWFARLEARRKKIDEECKEERPVTCDDNQSLCPDGSERDQACECAEAELPDCPRYACANGEPRNAKDCSCPGDRDETGAKESQIGETSEDSEQQIAGESGQDIDGANLDEDIANSFGGNEEDINAPVGDGNDFFDNDTPNLQSSGSKVLQQTSV